MVKRLITSIFKVVFTSMKDTILLSLKMIVGEYILKYDSLETSEVPEFQAKLSLFYQSNDLSNFVATSM